MKKTQPSENLLLRLLPRLSRGRVLIIGDVMMDEYQFGDASRVSPEAPVPVVLVEEDKRLVGGAGNVARNITSLGGTARLVGVRGQDAPGNAMQECLAADGIDADLLVSPNRPTTVKTRIMARGQQMLRVDRESSAPLERAEIDGLLRRVAGHMNDCSAIVVSDYGKGVVTQILMDGLRRLAAEHRGDGNPLPLLVDPKPQNFSCYSGVTLLTPNAKETGESVNMPVQTQEEIIRAGMTIMDKLECPHLLTTLGGRGMALFVGRGEVWHLPAQARKVFDVTGAGDTVIAVVALGLAAGLSLVEACLAANHAAGIVVGEVGSAVTTMEQLKAAAAEAPPAAVTRWV